MVVPTLVGPTVLEQIFYLVVPLATCFGFGFASALLFNIGNTGLGFSKNVFLVSSSIGIFIMVWVEALPVYFAVIAVLLFVLMLFGETGGDEYE